MPDEKTRLERGIAATDQQIDRLDMRKIAAIILMPLCPSAKRRIGIPLKAGLRNSPNILNRRNELRRNEPWPSRVFIIPMRGTLKRA